MKKNNGVSSSNENISFVTSILLRSESLNVALLKPEMNLSHFILQWYCSGKIRITSCHNGIDFWHSLCIQNSQRHFTVRKKNQPEAKNLVMMAPESDGFGFLMYLPQNWSRQKSGYTKALKILKVPQPFSKNLFKPKI